MEKETWFTLPGKYSKYEINEQLQVRHRIKKKIKSCYMDEGYLKMNLIGTTGIRHKPALHQLSALAFVPNPENKPEVHHIDEDTLNNKPSNLMWVTKAEHRRISSENEQTNHKLTRKDILYIRWVYTHELKNDLAKKYKVRPQTIYNVAIGESRPEVGGKFHDPVGLCKKVINTETGEIYNSTEEVAKLTGLKFRSLRRALGGERYNTTPYRYFVNGYAVNNALLPPPPKPKKEKPPKKERPPRKVYVPHPAVYRKMIALDLNGNEVGVFDSSGEAAKFVGSNPETFRRAVKRSPNGFSKGYIWKYA